ncbi:hypothetical protein XELAEV_18036602mg [Xenopus laevis]|uniref:Uncharacterized protein n=1 Tax=Xenopus laevis TaxID=8355 RepID=A0A974H9E2_XENLA|nr:hypothetical protein XELAEV_18036602mg [Xenopus laevis]
MWTPGATNILPFTLQISHLKFIRNVCTQLGALMQRILSLITTLPPGGNPWYCHKMTLGCTEPKLIEMEQVLGAQSEGQLGGDLG